MKRVLIAAAVALGFSCAAAQAQQTTQAQGWYGQVSGGWLSLQDVDGTVNGTGVKGSYDDGYALTLAGGYKFGNGFRAELEGGYGHSSFDSATIGGTHVGLNGDINLWSVYGAGYYDFALNGSSVKPYIGGGLGFVHSDVDQVTATSGGTTFTANGGDDDNFSAFGEVGLSFPIADRLELVPGVRYSWIDDGSSGIDDDTAWLVKVGLRYSF
jgi:opacity protein-like surface antigen